MTFRSRYAPTALVAIPGYLSQTLVCGALLAGCSSDEQPADESTNDTTSEATSTSSTSASTTSSVNQNTTHDRTSAESTTSATSAASEDESDDSNTDDSNTDDSNTDDSNTDDTDSQSGEVTTDDPETSEDDESTSEPSGETVTPDAGEEASTGEDTESDDTTDLNLEPFSFFVTSYKAIVEVSGSPDGFGGDLRYGEPTGLEGADKICNEIAEMSMPGSSAKQWRAFLSVVQGPDGEQVDAIDRIGEGPWYDRLGRLVGMTLEDLAQTRPRGADEQIINDLPNEDGVGNHAPDGEQIDNHHTLTGSNGEGRLYGPNATCADWTSTEKSADGRPRIGFSWPAGGREHWISGQDEGGCLPGIDLDGGGGGDPNVGTVGSGGGYGQFYCFALTP